MTIEIDEAIERYTSNAEYERTHGNLQGFLEFRQLAEWLRDYKRLKEQEPCDVPDINDGDIISKQTVLDTISELNAISFYEAQEDSKECYYAIRQAIKDLSPVKPQTGHWIEKMDACECPYCHKAWDYCDNDTEDFDYCPKCGTKLSEIPTGSKPEISSYYGLKSYVKKRSEE